MINIPTNAKIKECTDRLDQKKMISFFFYIKNNAKKINKKEQVC